MTIRRIAISIHDNRAGGVLPITAGVILTLVALAGAGLDLGRGYMAKSRLQSACDAAVLAGRKAQVNASVYDANAQAAAARTFRLNYANNAYNSTGVTFNSQRLAGSEIRGQAVATVPTSIIHIFGLSNFNFDVKCEARLDLPNTDIMFVLDTTLSMTEVNSGDTVDRMSALRTSVKNFHATIESAAQTGTQVRFGFVPYSSTVNVGRLLKPEWIVDKWTYNSRRFDHADTQTNTGSVWRNWTHISGSGPITTQTTSSLGEGGGSCVAPPNENYTSTSTVTGSFVDPATGTTIQVATFITDGVRYTAWAANGICTITRYQYNNYTETAELWPSTNTRERLWYVYEPIEYDVSPLKSGPSSTIDVPVGQRGANKTISWDGCIEERDTIRSTDMDTAPAGALDLDINTVPTPGNPATQWRPFLPGIETQRIWYGNDEATPTWEAPGTPREGYVLFSEQRAGFAACPSASSKLAPMTSTEIASYVDALNPIGSTHHDIGMIWGARLLSPNGLFASENSTTPNGQSIARHLILMTDGEMMVMNKTYNAYGVHGNDMRQTAAGVVPNDADLTQHATARFLAACETAKANNMTVWVIAFGTSLTSQLTSCATTGRAFQANNAAQLNDTFQEIATKIAGLRITE